ncbi:MAG: hypothetical protein ACE5GO_01920 [Anaerolineales bacterium]
MKAYVICIDHGTNPESLIVGKIYRVLPGANAPRAGLIRVLDETLGEPGSEDGYLYPESMFIPITLPEEIERSLERVYA